MPICLSQKDCMNLYSEKTRVSSLEEDCQKNHSLNLTLNGSKIMVGNMVSRLYRDDRSRCPYPPSKAVMTVSYCHLPENKNRTFCLHQKYAKHQHLGTYYFVHISVYKDGIYCMYKVSRYITMYLYDIGA